MTSKEIILNQLSATYNQKNWFVPVTDALEGLTAQQAAWSDGSGNHSIWQIVNHLIFWNERWVMRFKGQVPPEMEIENSETFDAGEKTEDQWKETVKKINEVLSDWESLVKKADDSVLAGEAFKGYGASWYEVLAQTTTHNAYHIGQILYVRKQQGVWNPDRGVK
jgi:uncharacterized damage-inducible protein DinB